MNMIAATTSMLERVPVPDPVLRFGISRLVGRTHRRMRAAPPGEEASFAAAMRAYPIAEHTQDANAQHYELPAAFFSLVLGPRRKYSSCFYETAADTLAQAETHALAATCAHVTWPFEIGGV